MAVFIFFFHPRHRAQGGDFTNSRGEFFTLGKIMHAYSVCTKKPALHTPNSHRFIERDVLFRIESLARILHSKMQYMFIHTLYTLHAKNIFQISAQICNYVRVCGCCGTGHLKKNVDLSAIISDKDSQFVY